MTSAYNALERRFRRIAGIEGALAVLNWDHATVMPVGGADARGEQIATLSALEHEILTAEETGDLLASAEAAGDLEPWRAANLREIRRRFDRATALPSDLVEALARATSSCEVVWRSAREASDFARLRPGLEEVVRLVREEAAAYGERLGVPPYAALLDGYEPGITPAWVDGLFAPLLDSLPDLLDDVLARQAAGPAPARPEGPFPATRQRAFGRELMEAVGFDFEHGRLDESHHPFCGGVPEDIRITSRWDERDPFPGIMAVLHETGHALYEAGLPPAWRHQPVGKARGMVVHESQSLIVEMQACRSRAFLRFLGPAMATAFGRGDESAFEPENLARLYTKVERGFIRVDADEITYPLHVMLRYRLEQDLIEGRLDVADLPEAWNVGMQSLVGVVPPDDRQGCLQDIHWPGGAFGYFPCYTLGALVAAQLFASARAAEPELVPALGRGDFRPLRGWLRARVHAQAARFDVTELVEQATGASLSAAPFLDHLKARYLT